jgi:RNA polymerase sigma-70 factor (ECF subfamily)
VQTEQPDDTLMRRFREGDAPAFEVLLKRHQRAVFSFIVRMVGDRTRAEDLLQETFLRVIRGAAEWEQKAKFTTWLYTIARNICVDAMRRESFRKADSLDRVAPSDGDPDGAPVGDAMAGAAVGADRAAYNARVRPALEQALQRLPAEQREVFVLREYSGAPFKEIAEMTGVPENTVKSRMRYALEGLRKALEAMGITGDMADDDEVAAAAVRTVGG